MFGRVEHASLPSESEFIAKPICGHTGRYTQIVFLVLLVASEWLQLSTEFPMRELHLSHHGTRSPPMHPSADCGGDGFALSPSIPSTPTETNLVTFPCMAYISRYDQSESLHRWYIPGAGTRRCGSGGNRAASRQNRVIEVYCW